MKAVMKKDMVPMANIVVGMALAAFHVSATAGSVEDQQGYFPAPADEGFHFEHHDWEVACDNTRTCRAAGYHADHSEYKVSVLLERKAGPSTPVIGEVQLGWDDDPDSVTGSLPDDIDLTMRIDRRSAGSVRMHKLFGQLSAPQVSALLKSLPGKSTVEFRYRSHRWLLSDLGAAAVLLKIDEFQGRIGRQGALVRKGPRPEHSARQSVPAPTLVSAPLPPTRSEDGSFVERYANLLVSSLKKSSNEEACPLLYREESTGMLGLESVRLTENQMLLSARCHEYWSNETRQAWVVESHPPFSPKDLEIEHNSSLGETLGKDMKGRNGGDCGSRDEWTWDGKRFVLTQSSTSGLCKEMGFGGAWVLPVWTMEVRHPSVSR